MNNFLSELKSQSAFIDKVPTFIIPSAVIETELLRQNNN